ncbi:hypothetical protein B9Z19DRAFT_1069278 [Tuber borchii]|uniref:Uncharacterized protein n=1 Tax=Tuber borchii TaxID=42251 RepID=A0A2T6ZC40_TUBBO|nr:hypothetical protein B9Z19DRAFT_1069278 [Tuber borchii]
MSVCLGNDYSSSVGRGVIQVWSRREGTVSGQVSSKPKAWNNSHTVKVKRVGKKRQRETTPETSPSQSPKFEKKLMDTVTNRNIQTELNAEIGPVMSPDGAVRHTHFSSLLTKLKPKEVLELQRTYEGRLPLGKVSETELDEWKEAYPELVENDQVKFEYNCFSKELQIICLPLPTHDALQLFFTRRVGSCLEAKFGSAAEDLADIGSGTSFSGFRGDPSGSSEKLPDAYVQVPDGEFPTIVCEAGFSEAKEELLEDAKLWLLKTAGQTKVVIILAFTEVMPKRGQVALDGDTPAGETQDGGQTFIPKIDKEMSVTDLAKQLFEVNKEGKLAKPLVGNLTAKLSLYKASKTGEDIIEVFSTMVLPRPPANDPGPTEFFITIEEVLGSPPPDGHAGDDKITFSIPSLQKYIERSITRTELFRATRRAKKLRSKVDGLEAEQTFAKSKKRRLDPMACYDDLLPLAISSIGGLSATHFQPPSKHESPPSSTSQSSLESFISTQSTSITVAAPKPPLKGQTMHLYTASIALRTPCILHPPSSYPASQQPYYKNSSKN